MKKRKGHVISFCLSDEQGERFDRAIEKIRKKIAESECIKDYTEYVKVSKAEIMKDLIEDFCDKVLEKRTKN